jgi:uncharacterized integral membrane protein (TIGR00698 family)
MFLYPLIGRALGLSAHTFGLWAGASIHEVAQVVGAAFSFDQAHPPGSSVEIATLVKLGRVLMLAPATLLLSLGDRDRRARGGPSAIPWFIWLFLGTVALRSSGAIPAATAANVIQADTFLLAVAMGAIGLDLRWARLRKAGLRPLYLAGLASLFIATLGLALSFL